MTLAEAKIMLEKQRIPYQTAQYENPEAYYRHLNPFSSDPRSEACPVTALVIPSVNGRMHIELQFQPVRGVFRFINLYFGDFDFEMFDHEPDMLEADLLEIIGQIADGKLAVIVANDLKRKKWLWGSCYDLTDDDDVFGAPGYQAALDKIQQKKTWLQRLLGRKLRYEIYDWRTYRCVET